MKYQQQHYVDGVKKKIETVGDPGGKKLYNIDEINLLFQNERVLTRKRFCYARVNSEYRRADL
jgi:predicted site-specific integrase-resolvase